MFATIAEIVGVGLILVFTAWGVGGLVASFGGVKRSRLATWWRGSRYGSVGEPRVGPVLSPDLKRDHTKR